MDARGVSGPSGGPRTRMPSLQPAQACGALHRWELRLNTAWLGTGEQEGEGAPDQGKESQRNHLGWLLCEVQSCFCFRQVWLKNDFLHVYPHHCKKKWRWQVFFVLNSRLSFTGFLSSPECQPSTNVMPSKLCASVHSSYSFLMPSYCWSCFET